MLCFGDLLAKIAVKFKEFSDFNAHRTLLVCTDIFPEPRYQILSLKILHDMKIDLN